MKSKFDPKTYQNKDRVYRPVPGAHNILRLWVWSKEKQEYRTPERGNVFDARRYEYFETGGRRRVKRTFETLEEARRLNTTKCFACILPYSCPCQ